MLGSDNASCLSSHDLIAYVHDLNKRLTGVKIKNWVYTEACTGKNCLDTHFSFVNITLKGFIMDGNNIINEGEIYEGLCHQGSIVGSTAVLFDGDNLSGPVLKNHKGKEKDFKAAKTGVRETNEVLFTNETPRVFTISER